MCCNKVFYPGQEPPSRTILSWSKIMLHPTQLEPLGISWRTGRGRHGLVIQKSGYEPHRTPLGPDGGSYPWHGASSNYHSTIVCGCGAGLGCHWDLQLGIGPWYVECIAVLAARVGHTHYQPTIYNATDPFYQLTTFEKNFSVSFCYGHYSLIHVRVASTDTIALCLHLQGNYHTGVATPKFINW